MSYEWESSAVDKLDVITSSTNHTIKYIKSLQSKKYRDQHHRFLVEGQKMVTEALNSNFEVEMLIFSENYNASLPVCEGKPRKIRCLKLTEQLFKSLSDTQSPQGVLAVMEPKKWSCQQVIEQTKGFVTVLDGIKDPGNLGTIIRTVDAVSGDGVILINECVDPYNSKAVRATMGSIFRVPIFQESDTETLLGSLVKRGWHIVAGALEGTDVFLSQESYPKTALIIGSESHGVSSQVMDKAHSLVKVPMTGGAESLNASVAAGILIYEIFRKSRNVDE